MTQQLFASGHALLIGVGADLPNTVDDAKGLADILKDPDRCAYPQDQVQLLTSKAADRNGILEALDKLAQTSDENSTVTIYFSGHGYRAFSSIGEAYFLIPYDYDINRLKQTAINGSEFSVKLRSLKAKKLLLLLDCCHAGGVSEAKGLKIAKAPVPPEALEVLSEGSGQVIIASSQADELSFAGKPYSAFTLALIESLCGVGVAKKDGYVHAADVAMHAREVVPGRTSNKQHPILHFERADNFAIAYYAGGNSAPKALPFLKPPEIEPEAGEWRNTFDRRGQTVHGPQTNIAGNVNGPVLSGSFKIQAVPFYSEPELLRKYQRLVEEMNLVGKLWANRTDDAIFCIGSHSRTWRVGDKHFSFWKDIGSNLHLASPEFCKKIDNFLKSKEYYLREKENNNFRDAERSEFELKKKEFITEIEKRHEELYKDIMDMEKELRYYK